MKKSMKEKRDGFNRRELLNKAREIINFIEQAHKLGLAAHDVEEALFRQLIELGYRAPPIFMLRNDAKDSRPRIVGDDEYPVLCMPDL
jgi:hypothetical protein